MTSCHFSHDGRYLVNSSDLDFAVSVWDVREGSLIKKFFSEYHAFKQFCTRVLEVWLHPSWVSSNYHHPPKLRGRLIKYWSEVNIMVIALDGVCHFYFWCDLWLWHYWQFLALLTNFVAGFPRRFPFKDEKEINYNIFERSIFKQMLYGKSCVPRMLE